MEEEEWRPVVGWEFYEVSNQGRVRSVTHLDANGRIRPGIIRKLGRDGYGYPILTLKCDGKQLTVPVHVLLAAAFIGPRPPGQQVRHIDGDPEHTYRSNLDYGTRKQNQQDMARHGRAGRYQASKTHCSAGHEYTDENTYVVHRSARRGRGPSVERQCRACRRAASKRAYRKRR